MNTIKWILLCGLFTVYLIFGGSIIMVLEQGNEISQNEQLSILRKDIQEILFRLDRDFYHNETSPEVMDAVIAAKEGVLNRISEVCGGKDLRSDENIEDKPLTWTFYNSVFFAFTAVTTIGYGNLTPLLSISRMFTVAYALFGIPINGIIISGLSDYYSRKLIKAHKRTKDKSSYDARIIFVFDIIFYLIPGILVFIVAPAGFFVVIEKWSFVDSIYFCFVTLSTIGFGDYVAGLGDGHNLLLWIYKIVIIVWIMFGLGYLLMILSFITKGMTSKQVRTVIEKKLYGIKSTKEKLSKDIDYMRRVVQELYLMKANKPIYPGGNEFQVEADVNMNTRKISTINHHTNDVRRNVSFNIHDLGGNKRPQPVALARSRSESALDNLVSQNSSTERANDDWVISDQLMANLVSAIAGNINEMVHAVDQLNEYEEKLTLEEFDNDNENDNENDEENHSHEISRVDDVLDGWRLEEFDSDEEILIEEDEDDDDSNLEQVVVHHPDPKPPETLLGKIGEAFRKISAGKRSPTEIRSRNVSRQEKDDSHTYTGNQNQILHRGSVERQTLPVPRKSREWQANCAEMCDPTKCPKNHLPRVSSCDIPFNKEWIGETMHRISSSRKISNNNQENFFHGESNAAFQYEPHHIKPSRSTAPSQRVSREHTDDDRKKLSLERKSLQELMKALDVVQGRLNNGELSDKPDKRPTRVSNEIQDEERETRSTRRRRKVGIFNPGFSFLESTFGKPGDKDKSHGV